jgi:hypothetical protein
MNTDEYLLTETARGVTQQTTKKKLLSRSKCIIFVFAQKKLIHVYLLHLIMVFP